MSARDLLESIFKIGATIQDAQQNAGTQSFDFAEFLSSDSFKDLRKDVETAIAGLKDNDFANAIAEIIVKQQSLRSGRAFTAMSTAELIQYSQLSNTRLMLAAKDVSVKRSPDFLRWIVEDALPVLANVLGIVLPLLV